MRITFSIAALACSAWITMIGSAAAGPIGIGDFTDPTVITFEEYDSGQITTQYLSLGIEFLAYPDGVPGVGQSFGTTVSDGTGSVGIYGSGSNFAYGGAQVMEFTTPVARAGAYVSPINGTQYLTAYDPAGVLLGSVTIPDIGNPPYPYVFAGWEADAIKWLVISDDNLEGGAPWSDGGFTTFFDNVTFEHAPEPGTLLLLAAGLAFGRLRGLRR